MFQGIQPFINLLQGVFIDWSHLPLFQIDTASDPPAPLSPWPLLPLLPPSMMLPPGASLARRLTFTAMSDDEEAAPASSPAHTRSGRVYVGNPGNRRRRRRGSGRRPKEAEGEEADGEEEQDDR